METSTSKTKVKNVLCSQMYFGNEEGREKLKIRNYLKIMQRGFSFYRSDN